MQECRATFQQRSEFHQARHATICESIYRVLDSFKPVDSVTVTTDLRRHGKLESVGGEEYLKSLNSADLTLKNVEC